MGPYKGVHPPMNICFVFYAEIRCEPLAYVPFGRYTNPSCATQESRYEATCELTCDVGSTLTGIKYRRAWDWSGLQRSRVTVKVSLFMCMASGVNDICTRTP